MKKKVAIIGAGGIAKCLEQKLRKLGIDVSLSISRKGYTANSEYFNGDILTGQKFFFRSLLAEIRPQAAFLAISTLDKGESARDYILACVERNIPVITCEKGSLAYYAKELRPHMAKIGFSATVGGGTRILKYLQSRHFSGRRVELHAVINGTLNYVLDSVAHGGMTLGQACDVARKLGYAEPGPPDPIALINGELKDVQMKVCVLFNTVFATDEFLSPGFVSPIFQNPGDIERLEAEAGEHRYVVSMSNQESLRPRRRIGECFSIRWGRGWRIAGAFRRLDDSTSSRIGAWYIPGGVGNSVHMIDGDFGDEGKYTLSGPGAGHEPTTTAMLADFFELCP